MNKECIMQRSEHPRANPSPPKKRRANESRPSAYNSASTSVPTRATQASFQLPLPSGKPASLQYASEDGVTHINIYSRGATELGRYLSHFYKAPFTHPFYGRFNSMEGFWYYIKAAAPDDQLRRMSGYYAKRYGRELPPGPMYRGFYEVIIEANFHKITQNPQIAELMVQSSLPFDHYYLLPPGPIFMRKPGFEWLVEGFEKIREELKAARAAGIEPAWPTPLYEAHLT